MKILITSGGTKVPIDEVRYIGNMSSGRYGAELAYEFCKDASRHIQFLYAKDSVHPGKIADDNDDYLYDSSHAQFNDYEYKTLDTYIEKAKSLAPTCDIIISCAAVSDYTVVPQEGKISSDLEEYTITLKKAPKVLPLFKQINPAAMVVGFKLLISPTYDEIAKAVRKQLNNGANLVAFNDLAQIKKGNNTRLLFDKDMNYKVIKTTEEFVNTVMDAHHRWSWK